MDALADLLSAARLGGAVFARTTPRAPWGLAFDAAPMAGFSPRHPRQLLPEAGVGS